MRTATIKRKTLETDVSVSVNLDGKGECKISTGIGFFDHMLTAFSRHSGFDLDISVKGDLEVDGHHTVEDTGIALGKAILEASGEKAGIERFSSCFLPMDESLAFCALDFCGRAYLAFSAEFSSPLIGSFDTSLCEEFFRALAFNSLSTLHLKIVDGTNDHHKTEALFKAAARCFKLSLKVSGEAVPSSKGCL